MRASPPRRRCPFCLQQSLTFHFRNHRGNLAQAVVSWTPSPDQPPSAAPRHPNCGQQDQSRHRNDDDGRKNEVCETTQRPASCNGQLIPLPAMMSIFTAFHSPQDRRQNFGPCSGSQGNNQAHSGDQSHPPAYPSFPRSTPDSAARHVTK